MRLHRRVATLQNGVLFSMRSYYFADYRLDVADDMVERTAKYLEDFITSMPYTHTFTLCSGNADETEERCAAITQQTEVCRTDRFSVYALPDGWAFVMPEYPSVAKTLLLCSRDYREMTVYVAEKMYFDPYFQEERMQIFPFVRTIRHVCEAGIALHGGIPLHASLVETNGFGIIFLGRSGIGKSTQAKLWQKYLNADFISGDRPCVTNTCGVWRANGMPWDGKDHINRQVGVRLHAVVSLEQADHSEIILLSKQQALAVLLRQTSLPMWDSAATAAVAERLGMLATEIPFYHLKNLADEEGVMLTYRTVMEEIQREDHISV